MEKPSERNIKMTPSGMSARGLDQVIKVNMDEPALREVERGSKELVAMNKPCTY